MSPINMELTWPPAAYSMGPLPFIPIPALDVKSFNPWTQFYLSAMKGIFK
jgi:hypothetical protein